MNFRGTKQGMMVYKKAFSLIELLLVVVIMGIVYTLSVNSFQKIGQDEESVTLGSLKKYLRTIPYEKDIRFLCLDDCQSCDVIADGKKVDELEGVFDDFLDDSVNVYNYSYNIGATKISQKIYFNIEDVEESVCFSYTMDTQGIGEQVLVEFKESVYDFSTYMTNTPRYNSLEEAIAVKEEHVEEVFR